MKSILIGIVFFSVAAFADHVAIIVDSTELLLTYGEAQTTHLEVELTEAADVIWKTRGLPPGLILVPGADTRRAEITGAPQFSGNWCFEVDANAGGNVVQKKLCYCSQNNFDLAHPRLAVERDFASARVGHWFQEYLMFDLRKGRLTDLQILGDIPPEFTFTPYVDAGVIKISGVPTRPGVWTFEVRATNEKQLTNSVQVRMRVSVVQPPPPPPEPDPDPHHGDGDSDHHPSQD